MQKTNASERKTGAARPQTARSEQNYVYTHVTELICSQEDNTVWQKSKRNDEPDSDISQLWLLREAVMDTNTSSPMYFAIVSKCFWGASIIS